MRSASQAGGRRLRTGLVAAAASLAVVASLVLAFVPAGVGERGVGRVDGGDGIERRETTREPPLVDRLDGVSIAFLVFPVAVAAFPLLLRSGRSAVAATAVAAGLLFLWVLFLAFGGGLFYLPSALLLALATAFAPSSTGEATGGR